MAGREPDASMPAREPVFWRVEGSLLNLTAVRPVGFFAWNAQSFLGRWARRGTMGALAVARPFLYMTNRVFATRLLHTVLRGVSRDRSICSGEEYFEYVLKPRLKQHGVAKLKEAHGRGRRHCSGKPGPGPHHASAGETSRRGANHFQSPGFPRWHRHRASARSGDPAPRRIRAASPQATRTAEFPRAQLLRDLGFEKNPEVLDRSDPAGRAAACATECTCRWSSLNRADGAPAFSSANPCAEKIFLLIGATGFIGKVWLANLLTDLPEIGRIYLLVRRNRAATALQRFQRIVEESPVFEPLAERHGDDFADFLRERVEVVDGDVSKPGLGLPPKCASVWRARST